MTEPILVGLGSLALAIVAQWQASRENRTRRAGRLVFDAWRTTGVVASAWVFGAVVALCAPYLTEHFGALAPSAVLPLLLELGIGLGAAAFAFFVWEHRHGFHTWQRYPPPKGVASWAA